jgi:hypothetical protein
MLIQPKRIALQRLCAPLLCDGLRRPFMALKQALNIVCWHGFAE